MPPLRWLFLVLCAVVAVRAADDSLIGSFKTMFFGNEPEKTNDSATSSQNNPPISYHQYATASSPSSRSQPPSGQSCTLPRQIGTGPYRIPRWYYNPVRGRCELFYWSGCCGNGNNFQTFQTCQSTCEESPNPCAVTGGATLSPCAPGQGCGTGSYCHVGAQTQTTVCCPKPAAVDRCQQPLNVGIGNSNLQRWYFNPLTQQCSTCTYRGLQGNENNFLSQNECEQSCLVNPCKIGSPYRSQGITVQCSAMSPTVCPAGHYCHLGADATTSVCCQALGNSPCEEEMTQGEGPSALTRFYYDASQRKCLAFNYLGLKGNRNNFQSKEHCESTCPVWTNPCAIGQPIMTVGQKPFQCHQGATCSTGYFCHLGYDDATTVCCQSEGDPCSLVVKEGSGNHHLSRWFYNSNTRQCQPFTYTGQGGNENNFLLREHCEATCPVWINACPSGEPYLLPNGKPQPCDSANVNSCPLTHWCHPGPDASTTMCCPGKADPCTQTLAQGEGPLSVARFYFNAQSRTCDEFMFRGLKGNSNNFKSQEDCEKACPVQQNPCPITMSSLKHSAKLVPCSATKSCPSQQWCHYGETKETTVCCPNAVDDPCTAPPRNPGVGEFHATRWAFDGSARKCVPFEYRGMKGNSNNFLTRENCEKRCPVFQNPCKIGEPHIQNNQYMQCSPQQVCPGGHYCHVGTEANYCCKALGGDPCGQPLDRGVGGSQLSRWYWNQQSQCCLPFSYCGQKGTQNNFLTKQDCDRTCYVFTNPCNQPIALPATLCSGTGSSDTCGANMWCHIGANQDSTVCCPSEGDPCSLPLARGSGNQFMDRFYYNQQTGSCQQFTYSGLHGNQNNFLTQQACEEQCGPNPCFEGRPFVGADGRTQTCSASANFNTCPLNHWCHIGSDLSTTVCCPGASTNACNLPMSTGEGNARLDRFYYDQQTKTCRPFVYNGLKGNQNNFISLRACQLSCQPLDNPCIGQPATTAAGQVLFCSITNKDSCPVNFWCHIGATPETTVCCPGATNPCSVPLAPGTGNAGLARYYYNPDDRQCLPFQYNGKRGNQNNFENQADCERTCPEQLCLLSIDRGACGGRQTRYAYNRQTNQCVAFEYTGCGGNLNNFVSIADCQATCGSVGFR
ncbi:BPTI/Kunitz inhibitor domain-containing protein [Caenorhabditis elegans]|uniref:BPTI/Kunitz inhibitor domain-containing protein n=1 Tax=Caenorhabditis elegans TaxID=6239 RepID=H2KMJ9_CAEEL|nr:BPTI/Kunitz inhibitor domain-containing protein [Caenorhabditis elegans]CCE71906.1 BPTI/Kunitz inhibitor domain-containing protein [Caenorhabditis elegans]|eukprot:NP_001256873.1 Uncharacterized protein CELE_Y43F8B.3 [Caenorhabditis elegans]